METFIALVLFVAWLQTCLKFALISRIWGFLFIVIIGCLPFANHSLLIASSLQEQMAMVCSESFLQAWCVILVVQEFLVFIMGLSLLSAYQLEEKIHWWKMVVFVPSFLIYPGVVFLQMQSYNHFVMADFDWVCAGVSAVLVFTSLAVIEGMRWYKRHDFDGAILLLFNSEFVITILAVFLPIAAVASDRLQIGEWQINWQDAQPLLYLLIPVLLSACGYALWQLGVQIYYRRIHHYHQVNQRNNHV